LNDASIAAMLWHEHRVDMALAKESGNVGTRWRKVELEELALLTFMASLEPPLDIFLN
jgi:precorrin-6x reductase